MDNGKTLARRVDDALAWAELGEANVVDVGSDPRPLLCDLIDGGALSRALFLITQEGRYGRIVVFPRRGSGTPTISELMEEDHRRLDEHCERASRYIHIEPLRSVAEVHEFAIGMRRHIAGEEAILFPLYEAEFGLTRTSTTAIVEREHRGILHYVDRLVEAAERMAGARGNDVTPAMAEVLRVRGALAALVESHSMREERTMFPQLDERLHEAVRSEAVRRLVLF